MKRSRTGHTAVYRGKRVLVWFKDGRCVEDRFLDRTAKYIVLAHLGKVRGTEVSNLSIVKDRERRF